MPSYAYRLTSPSSPAEGAEAKGPSKNELKKRAKEEEKARKAAEKAARQAELEAQKAAAEVVSPKPDRRLLPIPARCADASLRGRDRTSRQSSMASSP